MKMKATQFRNILAQRIIYNLLTQISDNTPLKLHEYIYDFYIFKFIFGIFTHIYLFILGIFSLEPT